MNMDARSSCDIIIPVFNKPDMTIACLESIIKNTLSPYKIIVIDNGSDQATKKALSDFKDFHENISLVRSEENAGWIKAVNRGIGLSSAPYVCIMNNDTVVETDDWLARLIGVADMSQDIGLVNPEFGDEKRPKGPVRPSTWSSARLFVELDFCRGYCILIKRAVIEKIGVLDEAYGMGYYDDDDYSVRAIRAGFRCVRAYGVTVKHLRDTTFSAVFQDEKRRSLHQKNKELFYAKWGRRLKVVFILTKRADIKKASEILLDLARKQHIVYLWNMAAPLDIAHINIRERLFWKIMPKTVFSAMLRLNAMKKSAKRYSAVFVDDDRICSRISPTLKGGAYVVNMERDRDRVGYVVDSAARV
jgi:GT2 family glycosyltransferase